MELRRRGEIRNVPLAGHSDDELRIAGRDKRKLSRLGYNLSRRRWVVGAPHGSFMLSSGTSGRRVAARLGATSGPGSASQRRARDESSTGAALVSAAVEQQATMIVMGAYTHSRLRQSFLGGVTKHLLAHAPVPLLMSH
jgi:nucleotide-binding universal stress UspA family protein